MLTKDTMHRYRFPIVSAVTVFVILITTNLLTNQDDVRYFLSALAQVEATLIGLYITILLVGIQLVREYSEVFYEIYFNDKEFWTVLTSAILLIVSSLVALGASEKLITPISMIELNNLKFTITLSSFFAVWATFNIISMIILLRRTFRLFYPGKLLSTFIDSFPFNYQMGIQGLHMYFRAISKTIQTQNPEVALFMLEYIIDKRLDKLLRQLHEEHLEEKLKFLEKLFINFRNLSWYTLDQFDARRISKDEATWVLEWIHRAFQITLPMLIIKEYPKNQQHKEQLERTINQILLELELIIEKLQASELNGNLSKKFCSLVQYAPYKTFNSLRPQIESIEEICSKKS